MLMKEETGSSKKSSLCITCITHLWCSHRGVLFLPLHGSCSWQSRSLDHPSWLHSWHRSFGSQLGLSGVLLHKPAGYLSTALYPGQPIVLFGQATKPYIHPSGWGIWQQIFYAWLIPGEQANHCSSHQYYIDSLSSGSHAEQLPCFIITRGDWSLIQRMHCDFLNEYKPFSHWKKWRSWLHHPASLPSPIRKCLAQNAGCGFF